MRTLWEVAKLGISRQLTYRAATFAGLITNFFFGLLRAAILVALFGQRQEVAGLTVQGAITYTGLTQAVIGYLSLFRWTEVMDSIYTGEISSALLKPMNFFSFWLSQDLGKALVNIVLRGLPIMVLYAFVFDITIPSQSGQWLALFTAIILGWLVSFSWRFLVNLAAFWTPNARGVGRFAFGLSWVLSGFIMPLRLFPEWFIQFCNFTPFPSMINTVVEVYLGVLDSQAVMRALLTQGFWVILLVAVAHLVLKAGTRRLVIQGG
jgi:ABC-2 type transport system permease protein